MKDEKKPLANSAKEQTNKTNSKKIEKKPKGLGFSLFFTFILFALIVASLLFAYTWYNPKITNLKQNVSSLNEQINTLKQNDRQEYLSNQIKQISTAFQQLKQKSTELAQSNKTALDKINRQIFLNKQSWVYSDIHYLLKLAVRRVNLVGDSKGAIAALEAADDEIRKIENAELLEIRKTIFDTIKTLQSVQEPDTEALVLKVNYIKHLLLSDKVEQKNNLYTLSRKPDLNHIESKKMSIEQSITQFFSQFFTIKTTANKQQVNEQKQQALLSKIRSEQVDVLLLIAKIKHAVLSMNQEHFSYYTQKLFDVLANKNTDIIIKSAVHNLSTKNVGISLPSASLPLLRYELLLEKMQQANQGAKR